MTDQDLLKRYRAENDTTSAASFLRFLTSSRKQTRRRYPDPRTKDEGKSGDWQITRSQAARAFAEGNPDDYPLLALHIRDAFQARHEDETPEERKGRAIEVLEACLDAITNHGKDDERNFFKLADTAAQYAIKIIENEKRFPTKSEVIDEVAKITKIKIEIGAEKTRILQAAYLGFLPSLKTKRSATAHKMVVGRKK